ncbi:hypothetical protein DNTS_029952 [Danionella cerebrum]|uniref:Ig-like domain-containing protein n=1 Tax=Danionella cerebrum TaxID=2873325 RepID=A0A553RQ13_9TELE|nr:hypothetical protein DNTS_029952 [Danionella translucida]
MASGLGNVITPIQTQVFASERSSVTLSCNFNASGFTDYLHWYRQIGQSRPEFLVLTYSTTTEAQSSHEDTRFTVNIPKGGHVDLLLSTAAVADTAVYFCALQPTVKGNPCAPYNNQTQGNN